MDKIEAFIARHEFGLSLGAGVLMIAGYVTDGGLSKVLSAASMLLIVLASTQMLNRKWVSRLMIGTLAISMLPKMFFLPGNIVNLELGGILAFAILLVAVLRLIQVLGRHRRLRLNAQV